MYKVATLPPTPIFIPKMWSQGNHSNCFYSFYSYLQTRAKAWEDTWKCSLLFKNVALQHATPSLLHIGANRICQPCLSCNWVNCDLCLILPHPPFPLCMCPLTILRTWAVINKALSRALSMLWKQHDASPLVIFL